MESTYQFLALRVLQLWTEQRDKGQSRVIVAIAGPPGSGKSTIVEEVVRHVSKLPSGPSIIAISADGFHLPLETLRALPNAKELLARRGAQWTFDGDSVVNLVRNLRDSPQNTIMVPTFDHATKDPVPDALAIGPEVQVCLIEGNYLLSNDEPWHSIYDLVDDRWFITVNADLARTRIAKRHLAASIEDTMDNALGRADENDMPNGDYVVHSSTGRYDLAVESLEISTR